MELLPNSQPTITQEALLYRIANRIRHSLELKEILDTTVAEVRAYLETDRVKVYQFSSDGSGVVIAESIQENRLPSLLGLHFPADDIPLYARELFVRARQRSIVDITTCSIGLSPLLSSDTGEPIDEKETRNWQDIEIQFIKQIATQLGIAIEQADLLAQTKYQARQLANALQDLQATQSKLIQTEKMSSLGQLVAGIAHEINNPVNFIHGNLTHVEEYVHNLLKFISILQTKFSQPRAEMLELAAELDLDFIIQDLPKTLSSMKIGTERITEIVLSLRNFSRLDEAELKAVNIHEGIDSTLLILEHRLKIKSNVPKIQLIKEYGNLPNVECYAGLLNQVIMNILSNAIDALEQRDIELFSAHVTRTTLPFLENANTIWIRTKTLDCGRVAIHIKDNGIGIAEEVQKNIFNPFFTTKPVGKGTGLGLSISYQIITETHQGELKCVSKLEEGTEFIIEIPIQQNFN